MTLPPLTPIPPSERGVVLHGTNPSAVVAAIKSRAACWHGGQRSPDGRKIGLVIEGGAMRSIYSAGATLGLAQLGFETIFDAVYATSAGAMNASYFLSAQPLVGISVYYDSCVSAAFLNPLRVWKILDIDYLFDRVVKIDKPLDTGRVLQSPSDFFVAIMDKETGRGVLVDTKRTSTPLVDVLKAATAMPLLYNRAVSVDGRLCVDGGTVIPFPLQQALDHGCTDILVFLTRPAGHRTRPPPWQQRRLYDFLFARGNPALNGAFARYHETADCLRDLALGRLPVPKGVNIATLCTEPDDAITRTSSNRDELRAAAVTYARKTLKIFGGDTTWELPA